MSFFHILAHSVLSGGRRLRLPEKSMGWLVVTLSFLKEATGNEAILHFQFSLSRRKKEKKNGDFFSKSRGHALAQPKIFFMGESLAREREDESCDCSCNQKERENFVTPDYGKVCS